MDYTEVPQANNMDFTFIPRLEHIALVKIVVVLWNHADVRALLYCFPFFTSDKFKKWQDIEEVVIEKASHLSLPKASRNNVLGYIKPIGMEIFSWLEEHKNIYFDILHLPRELYFSMQGLLDRKKTAEALIQDDSLHIVIRYRLACTYCLQNFIPELWKKIPEDPVKLFKANHSREEFQHFELLVRFFTLEMKGELLVEENRKILFSRWYPLEPQSIISATSLYQFVFRYSALNDNKAATEFFLQKLAPMQKEESLVRCAKKVAYSLQSYFGRADSKVLPYLLSQMDEEKRLQICVRNPYPVLKCLLVWPWQGFFIETADRVCHNLTANDYDDLLNQIVQKVTNGYQDWNYRQLFGQFWQKGTDRHKRFVLENCIHGSLLINLLRIKDMVNMSLIFKDATLVEKEEIVFYREDIVVLLIYNEGWDVLKTVFEHCVSSGDVVDELRQEFRRRDLTSPAKEEDIREEEAIVKKFFSSFELVHVSLFPRDWHKLDSMCSVQIRPKLQVFIERKL